MLEVTTSYATHFIDVYVNKHIVTGKHMTGNRVRILLLTLPFLLRDLIAPEVKHNETINVFLCMFVVQDIVYNSLYYILYHNVYHYDTACEVKFVNDAIA